MDSETKNDMDKLLAYETSHEVNNKQKDLGKKTVSKYNLKKISLNTKITNTKADLFS
ncbi:hypothetical protein H8D85_01725 [bacterium]|nr:hypothetical protein [bacterium]